VYTESQIPKLSDSCPALGLENLIFGGLGLEV